MSGPTWVGLWGIAHDPLCPFAAWPEEDCHQRDAGVRICDLIAAIRADEREQAAQRVRNYAQHLRADGQITKAQLASLLSAARGEDTK